MSNKKLDKIGIFLASACAVHCIATPIVFLLLLGIFGHEFHHIWESFDWICLILAPIIAFFPLMNGYKQHKNSIPLILFGIGFSMLTLGCNTCGHHGPWHYIFMIAGAAFIIAAHFLNSRVYITQS